MTSLNINDDVFIKEEIDIASHPKVNQYLFSAFKGVEIKIEKIDYSQPTEDIQYKSFSECDGMQLKQESCDMSNINIKPTSSICNDVLNNINIKHINNIETVREHFKGECDYCNRIYGCRQSLVKHIDKHVTQQTCKTCNVIFRTNTEYKNHARDIHSVIFKRQYVCNVCNKSFAYSSNLKYDQLRHKNERPFVCKICNSSFTLSCTLKRHQLTHSNERPYVCNVCNKSFTQSSTLKYHRRTHTNERPFVCDVCNKSFSRNCTLKSHQLTHTNERPYICNVCNKCFAQSSTLKHHELTHTNERHYSCDICNKSFVRKSSLKCHQLTHSNESHYGSSRILMELAPKS